jgi:hypothetical protein
MAVATNEPTNIETNPAEQGSYLRSKTGRYESIIELPGFTRGLSFLGPLAFIGLS